MSSPRLAIVLSHPTQYYSPWFRWLRTHTALNFRVFYLWKFGIEATRDPQFEKTFTWDIDLLGGYENEFVPNLARDPGTHHFTGLRNPALTARLAAWRPDALLLFGYAYASHLRALAWARCHGVPLVFRGDSHLLGRPALPSWKKVLFRTLYRQFAALTYVGTANHGYFTALGVPAKKLFFAPHSVNHGHFDPSRPEYRAAAQALRAQLGLAPGTRVVLFAGKLTAAKQPRELLEAFLALDAPDTALVLAGDGEEKSALLDRARAAPPGRVHFLPFANQSEMPARYLFADIFALPSRGLYETWGLAVNEAMLMGVPCLVSDLVGCQRDLVLDGETGWVCRAGDAAHLREKLAAALATTPGQLERIKQAIALKISGYTYAQTTTGLLQALAFAAPDPTRNA
ncbi:MAG TPA: glycosyltransferase family 4 protein [Opitutaceae bacterium]|jgi:glycosyltransferase involved in cell wall biosynthesis|nr:glycosyltransferase family 4 protein [Opitutaceae bacterium]